MSPSKIDYWQARMLLQNDVPLPVDLIARLETHGFDVVRLQERYAK